ncbi:MAG: hypothetical protein NVS1B4_06600 [Gemmatimonadaceae bacterium]
MSTTLAHLISTYGYIVVGVFVFIESIGVPVPGETALVTAAAFAASGKLSILGVIASATAGAIAGGPAGYWVGMAGGLALVRRQGKMFRITEERLAKAHEYFERHGAKTVFIARFVAILRFVAAILAGVTRMPFGRFFVANAAGGLVWSATFGALGFAFGANLPRLERYLGRASVAVAALGVVVALGVMLWRWRASQPDGADDEPPATSIRGRVHVRWMAEIGVRCMIGLAISLGALAAFAAITEDVVSGDPLTVFDIAVAEHIHGAVTSSGVTLSKLVSQLGSPPTMGALLIAGSVVLWRRRNRVLLVGWVTAFIGGGVLDLALKMMIRRPRPLFADPVGFALGFSFPSGHAMGALIGYGALAYVMTRFPWGARRATMIDALTVALIIAIGASRLYLGVHYFSDVVGGFAAGTVWLAAVIAAVEAVHHRADAKAADSRV